MFNAFAWELSTKCSGNRLVIYKVEMDTDEVVQVSKANFETYQITFVDTTNLVATLSNDVEIFPGFDKLLQGNLPPSSQNFP